MRDSCWLIEENGYSELLMTSSTLAFSSSVMEYHEPKVILPIKLLHKIVLFSPKGIAVRKKRHGLLFALLWSRELQGNSLAINLGSKWIILEGLSLHIHSNLPLDLISYILFLPSSLWASSNTCLLNKRSRSSQSPKEASPICFRCFSFSRSDIKLQFYTFCLLYMSGIRNSLVGIIPSY